ncbi:MAG: hypothetical protein LBU79_07920 [Planctomycetota bacterium]|jgi:BMFP domain-containing protein YqiC|nr:hypothetical protein [Planctomycetota bacterium]
MQSLDDKPLGSQSSRHFHPHRLERRSRWLRFLAPLVCVLAGAVIGSGLTLFYFRRHTFPRPPRIEDMAQKMMDNLQGVVSLDVAEEKDIRAVVISHLEEVGRLRRQSSGEIRGIFEEMHVQVLARLDSPRREKWDAAVAERRQHWDKNAPGRP